MSLCCGVFGCGCAKGFISITKEKTKITIGLGVHSGDHTIYPDCRQEFFTAIEDAFKIGNWESERIQYYLPYIEKNKHYILKDALKICKKLNLDFDRIFSNTNTCYNPNKKGESCGKCGSCTERLEAFELLKRTDPVTYSKDNK